MSQMIGARGNGTLMRLVEVIKDADVRIAGSVARGVRTQG